MPPATPRPVQLRQSAGRTATAAVPWRNATLSLAATALLSASLLAVGVPLWLSLCVGTLGGLRTLLASSAHGAHSERR
jgi:hypothetical protein